MPFTTITKPSTGDPTKKTAFADAVIDDLNDLNTRLSELEGTPKLVNGSFEVDSDSDDVPDGWTETLYTGGSATIDTTNYASGQQSYKITTPGGAGNGGGYLQTTDFIEVRQNAPLVVFWQMKSTANINNQVVVYWYKADQTASATASTTLYTESTNNPTGWTRMHASANPPSDAYYCKLRLVGGHTSVTNAGDCWFDDVGITQPTFGRKVTYNLAGSHQFVAPATGVFKITATGGGGGGGNNPGGSQTGGGGGGGETAISFKALVSGTEYALVVGAGGAAGSAGTASNFNSSAVLANPGSGGTVANPGVGGAGGTGGTGDILISGQAGSNGGTGGGSGGPGGFAALGGGGGRKGVSGGTINAGAGVGPGGGGGGGAESGGTGGAGAAGSITFEW